MQRRSEPMALELDRRRMLAGQMKLVLRLPDEQQQDRRDDRNEPGRNVDELRADESRDAELRRRERCTADERSRQHTAQRRPAAHDEHQVSRDE